jgi:uncharacterized protein
MTRTMCRPRRRHLALAALMLGLAVLMPLAAQQPVPALTQRVTDQTGTLSAAARVALEARLEAFEARKGSQIAVLLVATTAPESIEQYALRVVEAWGLGRSRIDDGILLLVAKEDRKLRIEVGYGLEGAVPDVYAQRVISERIVPRFYADDYAGGLEAGVDALIGLIDGEPLPEPDAPEAAGDAGLWEVLPIALFAAAFLGPLFRRLLGALPGALTLGAGAGGVAWLVTGGMLAALLLGILVFGFALTSLGGHRHWSSGGPGGSNWGRSTPGAWGGRSSGGFSGGGGRFGGGGASGGW